MFLRIQWLVVLGMAIFLSGCKNNEPKDDRNPGQGRPVGPPISGKLPDWVNRGSRAFEGDRGKTIMGVGAVSGVRNPALLRRMTDNQARVEVAKILRTNVTSLAKSYARSVGNMDTSQEEQLVQDVSKSYTEATLSGVDIVDHHYDQATRTQYALAVLDLETFKRLTENAKQMSKDVQNYILKNAGDAFKELENMKK